MKPRSTERFETVAPIQRREKKSPLKSRTRPSSENILRNGAGRENLPSRKLEFIEPMKCRLADAVPEGTGWLYEVKLDGIRTIALKDGKNVQLFSRTKNDLTARFGGIADAIGRLSCKSAVLDGEAIVLDEQGRSSFQLLQSLNMPGERAGPVFYYAFDLLQLDGKDLRGLPLEQRKKILARLLQKSPEPIRISSPLEGAAGAIFKGVKELGLEGVIAKRRDSKYESGARSSNWLKIKTVQQQEFVIGGYSEPEGARAYFGAILVGYYSGGKLLFASKVGTGFDFRMLKMLFEKFRALSRERCPFANLTEPRRGRGGLTAGEMRKCKWIEPGLVCEIRFAEWTRDGHLRQPVFLGLRQDKPARDVKREQA
jgi:bifunctional non-homologous end joining protein LigD